MGELGAKVGDEGWGVGELGCAEGVAVLTASTVTDKELIELKVDAVSTVITAVVF